MSPSPDPGLFVLPVAGRKGSSCVQSLDWTVAKGERDYSFCFKRESWTDPGCHGIPYRGLIMTAFTHRP
jgi:hypothetical protein